MIPSLSQALARGNRRRSAPLEAVATPALQAVGDSLLHPALMLAPIVFLLGGSNRQIALFATLAIVAWTLAPIARTLVWAVARRTYAISLAGCAGRVIAGLLICFTGLRTDDLSASRIVGNLIAAYAIYQVSAALSSQASSGTTIGSVPRALRDQVVSWRQLAALIFALASALAAWRVLRSDGTFQDALGRLLILAGIAVIASTWFALTDPGIFAAKGAPPPLNLGSSIGDALGNGAFRRFGLFRFFLALVAAVDPFLIVYGFQELGLQVEFVGLALVAYAAGSLAGHLVWPRWIARSSPRVPLQLATLFRALLLLWVLSLPTLIESPAYTDRFDGPAAAMRGFALGFVLLGLAGSVGHAGNLRYLMDIAARTSLSGLIVAANILAAVTGLSPLGVAWLLGRYELERILWAAAALALVALLASGLLVESRVRVRASPGAWRTRSTSARTA